MSRIVVVRQFDEKMQEMDAAIIVQDDDKETIVHGRDKIIKKSIEKDLLNGATLDDILTKYDRRPYMWTKEMNDTRYEYGTNDS